MRPVSDATTRIRRQRHRSRLRTMVRVLVVGVLVVLLGAGVWLVGFSPVLAVERVQVTGAEVLDPAAVEQTAAIQPGTPLARLDTGGIEQRVAALAPVRRVEVVRQWPSGVTIRITERTPLYAVRQNQAEGYLLVDRDGVAYTAVPAVPKGLLVVSADSAELLPEIAAVVAALPDELRSSVKGVSAKTRDSIQLSLTEDRTAIWGSSDRSDYKADVLMALLHARKGKVYDVSAPDWPAVR